MGSQQRKRTAAFSITIPVGLLPTVDAEAAGYRSTTACLESKIIAAEALSIRSRISGLCFDDLSRLGRWLRLEIRDGRRIGVNESSTIRDRLSSIKIEPVSAQSRRTQPIKLDGPNRTLSVRTLPSIKSKASTLAEASGLSLSALCVKLLISQPVYPKPSTDDAKIAAEIGKISGLLILADGDHSDIFINRDHHREATRTVNTLLQQWRRG